MWFCLTVWVLISMWIKGQRSHLKDAYRILNWTVPWKCLIQHNFPILMRAVADKVAEERRKNEVKHQPLFQFSFVLILMNILFVYPENENPNMAADTHWTTASSLLFILHLLYFFALSSSLIIFPSFNYFAEIYKNALNDLRKTAHKYFISTSLTNIVIVIEKVIIFFKPRWVFMEHISGFSQAHIFGVDCAWWHTWFLGNENVMRLLTYLSYYNSVLFFY